MPLAPVACSISLERSPWFAARVRRSREIAVSTLRADDRRIDAPAHKARGALPDAPDIDPACAVAGDPLAHEAFSAHPK